MSRNYGIPNPEAPLDDLDDHWAEPPGDSGWWASVLLAVTVVIFLLGFVVYAFAHDHSRSDLDRWFRQQYSMKGPCCDGEEAHHMDDVDWDSTCVDGKCHYRVFLYNKWWTVDDGAVVQGPNLSGTALVWAAPTRNQGEEVISVFIRCFMPGAGG